MNQKRKKILVYRLGSLGDTIIVLPCFHKIKEAFPDADITLLTNRPVASKAAPLEAVLGSSIFFDRVLDYPIGTRNILVLFKLFSQIRKSRFDLLINLSAARSKKSAVRDRLFFQAAGIKKLIGFPKVEDDYKISVDSKTGEYEWEAKRLARRLQALGEIDLNDDRYWDLGLSDSEIAKATELIGPYTGNGKMVAISAGTKMQAKDWGKANWLDLVRALKKKLPGWKLILVGSADEAVLAEECLDAWNGAGINLCGKTSPRVSAAVLKRAALFIGQDSGPMHLAACVGIPCVAIFSSRNLPRQWYPKGDANTIIYHKVDCAGCGLETCIEQKKKCILSITVEEVTNAVLTTLKLPALPTSEKFIAV